MEETTKIAPSGNNSILAAFKNEFSTSVNSVYINSQKKEVGFREVSVNEQKTLSKIMIENENRKDIIYDTQCALINKLATEDGFDIYKLTEFDRIRVLMQIYESNYFKNDIHFKCPECGKENVYRIDFTKVMKSFDAFDLKDITYTTEDKNHTYNFILNYPLVSCVSNFYRQYMKLYKNKTTKEREALDDMGNVEYINLYIKGIECINKSNPENKLTADLTIMSYQDIEELISAFPQDVIFSEDKGVLTFITKEFIEKMNGTFNHEKCAYCGAETKEGIGSVADFF